MDFELSQADFVVSTVEKYIVIKANNICKKLNDRIF